MASFFHRSIVGRAGARLGGLAAGMLLAVLPSLGLACDSSLVEPASGSVDDSFDQLQRAYMEAMEEYRSALEEAREEGAAADAWPASPAAEFYRRFLMLYLEAGSGQAGLWCIENFQPGADSSRLLQKLDIYKNIARQHRDAEWLVRLCSPLAADVAPERLGAGITMALFDELDGARPDDEDFCSEVAWFRAGAWRASMLPDAEERMLAGYRSIAERWPETIRGQRAAGRVFRSERLQVGMPCPAFEGEDVDGAPIRSSDFEGKVAVISFWGFWCSPCVALLPHEKALVERLEDEPFAFVGINSDSSRDRYRELAAEAGLNWPNIFAGSNNGELPLRWGVSSWPTLYVLDSSGTIRFQDLRGDALDAAVDQLLAEGRGGDVVSPDPPVAPQEPEPPREPEATPEPEPEPEPEPAVEEVPLPPQDEPEVVEIAEDVARLTGRVVWAGKDTPPKQLTVSAEAQAKCCGTQPMDMLDRSLVIGAEKGVQDVVIVVTAGEAVPSEVPVVVDQRCCRFEPHVQTVPVGSKVRFLNSDSESHNVRTTVTRNQPTNKIISGGRELVVEFDQVEVVRVGCDIHPWMSGVLYVHSEGFATVTRPDGSFSIDGLPPGEYSVEYWHEDKRVGKGKQKVVFSAGEASEVTFEVGKSSGSSRRRRR